MLVTIRNYIDDDVEIKADETENNSKALHR